MTLRGHAPDLAPGEDPGGKFRCQHRNAAGEQCAFRTSSPGPIRGHYQRSHPGERSQAEWSLKQRARQERLATEAAQMEGGAAPASEPEPQSEPEHVPGADIQTALPILAVALTAPERLRGRQVRREGTPVDLEGALDAIQTGLPELFAQVLASRAANREGAKRAERAEERAAKAESLIRAIGGKVTELMGILENAMRDIGIGAGDD